MSDYAHALLLLTRCERCRVSPWVAISDRDESKVCGRCATEELMS